MIQDDRIQFLNDRVPRLESDYVLYWMQASQRTRCNHALEHAIRQANRHRKPLLVYLGVTADYPGSNRRHHQFMLEGIRELRANLARRGIPFLLRFTDPAVGAMDLSQGAVIVITDAGYQRHETAWRRAVAQGIQVPLFQVETNVVIPVTTVSPKEEYAAATIRRKIERLLPEYAQELSETRLEMNRLPVGLTREISDQTDQWLLDGFAALDLDETVPPVSQYFRGGEDQARELLADFLRDGLSGYAEGRNDPATGKSSDLSAYLHFGQISPLAIYRALPGLGSADERSFIDELIVRRELAMNFVHYNPHYHTYDAITSFARTTLEEHRLDQRPFLYTLAELESAITHDPYWNAAQREMMITGKMSGYMRMYWGKKVLEWSPTPEAAYDRLVILNNKYSLDGRDPNGYAGIAWCFGKHDRAWSERPVFGKVRYMNDKGLERKFRIRDYVRRIDALAGEPDLEQLRW